MSGPEILELKRVFSTRLDTLDHLLTVGERHLPDMDAALRGERLAPDMLPLGTQVAFTCNQPRGFAQWCAGQPAVNLDPDVTSIAIARAQVADTRALLASVDADDSRLDEIKRTDVGPDVYLETPARLFVSDFLMPNFLFHLTITYAILRRLGVPVGKVDYLGFLAPHVRHRGG